MTDLKPTREPDTERKYRINALRIASQTAHHLGLQDSPAPSQILDYFRSKLPQYSPSTVRQYKCGLRAWWESVLKEHGPDPIYEAAIQALDTIHPVTLRSELPPRTSAQKQKSVNFNDLTVLTSYLLGSSGVWAPRTLRFLQAGIATGLRPNEWANTIWLDDTHLRVVNAKATNGRSHGETRIIEVPKDHWLREAVEIHMANIQEFLSPAALKPRMKREPGHDASYYRAETFRDDYYEICRRTLGRACDQLWPSRKKHYSLYSGRHQFAANKKSAAATKKELAYDMGHGSEETARRHYGKKRSGWGNVVKPQPGLAHGLPMKVTKPGG